MAAATLLFLFATSVAAQLTTSMWLPKYTLKTERIRFLASVVAADKDRLTLAVTPENDTDYEALALDMGGTDTYTIASTLFEFSTSDIYGAVGPSTADYGYSYRCEMQTADTEASCTVSMGQVMGRGRCQTATYEASTWTKVWSFTETDTTGVETLVWTRPSAPTTPVPDWCSVSGIPTVPSSALTTSAPVPRSSFGTYQIIITAGEEKISAASGGTGSTSSAGPTGSQASSGGTNSSTAPTGTAPTGTAPTGAAAPMKTMVPALAGLGAAVAVFL